ncbi:hypothetical protein OF83DRAFT_1176129 [Amylostereum chailletii]|nr:hypothetical protein OF83DRAFT_1176129 [Amylostereum chailletii]
MDPENHRSYWYEDGDIVIIAANTFKFRVHKNKLAIHSSVLKARTVAPHQEVIDGYPTIRLDDDADDVGCMLQGIYDTRAFDAEQLSFDFVSASLRLGTKYKIGSIRVNAIARLTAFWPNTLAEYDRGRAQDSTCINMCYNDAYAEEFVAAQLALTYDIPELLPVVLYGCCTWTTDNLADALKRTEKKFGHTTPLPSLYLLSMVTKGAVELTKLRGKVLFAFLDGELI